MQLINIDKVTNTKSKISAEGVDVMEWRRGSGREGGSKREIGRGM